MRQDFRIFNCMNFFSILDHFHCFFKFMYDLPTHKVVSDTEKREIGIVYWRKRFPLAIIFIYAAISITIQFQAKDISSCSFCFRTLCAVVGQAPRQIIRTYSPCKYHPSEPCVKKLQSCDWSPF